MEDDVECFEYQANDEFVFFSGAVVSESSANIKCSQRSKVSNLKPIPTTLTSKQKTDCELPNMVGSARAISPLIPEEVIALLPLGLRNLSQSDDKLHKNSVKNVHRRKLSHNYDYLHDLVTCDAIQVLTSRPSHLSFIMSSALSSVQDSHRSDQGYESGERSGESSTTNSLNSTSDMSVDSSNGSTISDQYAHYNCDQQPMLLSAIDDYDNFTDTVEGDNEIMKHELPMGIGVTDYSEYSTNINVDVINQSPYANTESSYHSLNKDADYNFEIQSDELILRECTDFIRDNSPDFLSLDDSKKNNSNNGSISEQCNEINCNSIYDNVEIINNNYSARLNNRANELSPEPVGRPPCSPMKGKRSASPRRQFDSLSFRRCDIPRRAIKQKTPRTKSVHENQIVKNSFQKDKNHLIESLPNGDTKKEKVKNKSLYHYVKKLLT